jgi:N-acetylglucosaminyldiphosphoundecaprenol N-acetyl-beta-D-mannosaminyltransferase
MYRSVQSGSPGGRVESLEDGSRPVERVSVLGVAIANLSMQEAVARMEALIRADDGRARGLYIVNAHTLNLAWEDRAYRDVLNAGDLVLGDGTGVRWAARAQGVRMRDNLVGTDLMPFFFRTTKGHRYFLLGAQADVIERAAAWVRAEFPGLDLVGYHHGHIDGGATAAVIDGINAARPDVLLVGMGNPVQERWIHDHLPHLKARLAIGVGGLFDHWGGVLTRAPGWVRRQGFEWLQLLVQQPHKWRRYLVGNPKFLARAARDVRLRRPSP